MSQGMMDSDNFSRFTAGTSYSSTYKVPPQSLYAYKPLPASHKDVVVKGAGVIHGAHDLFPTLKKTVPEVNAKIIPKLDELLANLQAADSRGTGFVTKEQLMLAMQHACILFTDSDFKLMAPLFKHDIGGRIDYLALTDLIVGREATPLTTHDASLTYSWESDHPFEVTLASRPEQPTFQVPAWRMRKFATQATLASQEQHGDPGKVASMLTKILHDELLILPEKSNEGDMSRTGVFDLSFRRWLYGASTSSLLATQRRVAGPNASEVAEVFSQIVHDGLGVARVTSHTHSPLVPNTTLTATYKLY